MHCIRRQGESYHELRSFICPTLFFLCLSLLLTPCLTVAGSPEDREKRLDACSLPSLNTKIFDITFEREFEDIEFQLLIQYLPPTKTDPAHYFVEHRGVVRRFLKGNLTEFMDISEIVNLGSQWGLQELAFHPNFPEDPRIFVNYVGFGSKPINGKPSFQSRLSVFFANSDRTYVPTDSEVVLIESAERKEAWHPIAGIKFGPDGLLYVGWGEGTGLFKKKKLPNGKMLRIDVGAKGSSTYNVPKTNPAVDETFPAAIALGVRNPWRFSFIPETGEVIAGDVGNRDFEEINIVTPGNHYGWPNYEGHKCLKEDKCDSPNTPPLATLSRDVFCAVIGGYVYQGAAIEKYKGKYLFADICSQSIWGISLEGSGAQAPKQLGHLPGYGISSFAQDLNGELYVSAFKPVKGGKESQLLRLVANPAASDEKAATILQTLQETNCLSDSSYARAFPGFIPYAPIFGSFDNQAQAYRSFAWKGSLDLYGPTRTLVNLRSKYEPVVFVKNLEVDGKPVETQIIHANTKDGWQFLDYKWNASGDKATLLQEPTEITLANGKRWRFAGSNGCQNCHNHSSGYILGFSMDQINFPVETSNGTLKSQYEIFRDKYKAFKNRDFFHPKDPLPVNKAREQLAKAYLDVNCSHCHNPTGQASSLEMDYRFETPLADMGVCDTPGLSLPSEKGPRKRLQPGNPEESLVVLRMRGEGSLAMPPGRFEQDVDGISLVAAWIRSLQTCPDRLKKK